MPKAVSNSSPLIHLAKAKLLDIVSHQFKPVLVPPAVWNEAVVQGAGFPDSDAIAAANWITTHEVQPCPLLTELRSELHEGEAEAIVLAIQVKADYILLDEHEARRVAKTQGLRVIGLVGVLLKALSEGLIGSMEDCLDKLEQTGFRLSRTLREQALEVSAKIVPRSR